MSYKAEVIADASGKWVSNLLRFANHDEAWAYGNDLSRRWTLVRQMRVVEAGEPVNAQWTEDGLRHLEGVTS